MSITVFNMDASPVYCVEVQLLVHSETQHKNNHVTPNTWDRPSLALCDVESEMRKKQ